MTIKEFVATIKRHQATIETLEAEIEKVKDQYLADELAKLNLRADDIVEVEDVRQSFGKLDGEVKYFKGYIKDLRVEDDGDIIFSLGATKKNGKPAAIGTLLYYVHLTGKFRQRVRKVKGEAGQ